MNESNKLDKSSAKEKRLQTGDIIPEDVARRLLAGEGEHHTFGL